MTPEDRFKKLGSTEAPGPTEADWLEFRARAHRSVARRRIAGAVGGLALVLAVVGSAYAITRGPGETDESPRIAGTPTESPVPEETTGVDQSQRSGPVQQWFIEHGTLQVFYEEVPAPENPLPALVTLLDGVPSILAETGVSTAVPEDTTLEDLEVSDGVATVTLAGNFPDDSDAQQNLTYAQIVWTMTQFPMIDEVALVWESAESGGVGTGPESRDMYQDLLAPIVVEYPYPDRIVGRTFELSGIANVYEATVSWRLIDEDGNIFKEGFVTATCGSGCWGTFEDRISLEGVPGDRIRLEVFESSAEDGAPMNIVRIPLTVRDSF